MKKLPCITLDGPSARQEKCLLRWLSEWHIDRTLFERDDESVPSCRESLTLPVSDLAEELPLAVGQVRLLSPVIPVARNRLIYLAVLGFAAPFVYRVVPFGRFTEPAFAGELLIKRRAKSLRVLCLWNHFNAHVDTLSRSWVVDILSRPELDDAISVLGCICEGSALPDRFVHRVGPPLWHPADPRFEYQQEEAVIYRSLMHVHCEPVNSPWAVKPDGATVLKAADHHDVYLPRPESASDSIPKRSSRPRNNSKE